MKTFLVVAENQELGYNGILTQDSPDHFEPGTGLTLAHDILEHVASHPDPYVDEFMALGAMVAVRVEQGYRYSSRYLKMEDLANEVYTLVQSMYWQGETLTEPTTLPQGHDLWQEVLSHTEEGINNFLEEEDDENIIIPENLAENITAWVIEGYENCLQHYGGHNLYGICHLFKDIAEQCDKWLKYAEIGDRAILTMDLESGKVILEEYWEWEGIELTEDY